MCVFINFIHTILICTVYRHEANTNFRLDVINHLTALKNINTYIYFFFAEYVSYLSHFAEHYMCVPGQKHCEDLFALS